MENSGIEPFGTGGETHTSNLGFQLDSIATMGRKVRERKGA